MIYNSLYRLGVTPTIYHLINPTSELVWSNRTYTHEITSKILLSINESSNNRAALNVMPVVAPK